MEDVAIVGSGPAGLSAALYTTRAGLSTVVYSGETRGGLPTTTELVDNYLGLPGMEGMAMAETFLNHAESFGADIRSAVVDEISHGPNGGFMVVLGDGSTAEFRSVIYAAGSKPRKLDIPGETLSGVSWCSVCDGAFFKGDPVAVVGGGESAVEEAIYLSGMASEVTVLVRGEQFRANAPAVENLLGRPNVSVRYGVSVEEILGDDAVEELLLSDGSRLPVYGIFEAIGQIPQSATAHRHAAIAEDGFIESSTSEGFFVAGDIFNAEHRQIAVAVGDGAKAAMDAIKWLQNN